MGCHTWFYKKVKGPDTDKMYQTVVKRVQKEIEFLKRLIDDRESIDADLLEAYPEWTPEFANQNIPIWQGILDQALDRTLQFEKLCEYYEIWSPGLKHYVEGKGWFDEVDGFHDEFRKYGYPDDRLYSLEETLAYIENPENNCTVYETTKRRLKEFWEKYPEGMIEFG